MIKANQTLQLAFARVILATYYSLKWEFVLSEKSECKE